MERGVYVFFATALICASIYAFFFIHDTKGLRMDQMDELFGFAKREDFIAQADKKTADDEDEYHEKAPVHCTETV
jgi:hypothetical protein